MPDPILINMARKKIPFQSAEIETIEKLAAVGLNKTQIASYLGCSKATLERRLLDTPGAKEAILKGRAVALANVSKTAYEMAMSKKFPALTIFYLKCRGRWREKDRIEVTGKDGAPVETKGELTLTIRDYTSGARKP